MIYPQWSQQRYETLQRFLLPIVLVVTALLLVLAYGRPIDSSSLTLPDFGRFSLPFVPNAGQSDAAIRYMAHMPGAGLFFTDDGLIISGVVGDNKTATIVRWSFHGADTADIVATNSLPGVANYLIGEETSKWKTNLPTFGTIRYKELYPGVDIAFGGVPGQLVAIVELAAGVDPDILQWQFEGITTILNDRGGLTLLDEDGRMVVSFEQPKAMQQIRGETVPVTANFIINNAGSVGLTTGAFNPTESTTFLLVLNPPEDHGSDWAEDVVSNAAFETFVTGTTSSSYFPTVDPLQSQNAGSSDVFVTKFSSNGNVVYSTYLGGDFEDTGGKIDIDSEGNIVITGVTDSTNFPLMNALMGDQPGKDTFISKISADGSQLLFSTYLGGSEQEGWNSVAIDDEDDIYIFGTTWSIDFPLLNPIQGTFGGGFNDTFVSKISGNTYQLLFSTFLGGTEWDDAGGIDIDHNGNVFVAGSTASADFPVINSGLPQTQTGQSNLDVFISKIAADGSAFLFSGLFGGSWAEAANDVSIDPANNVYIVGYTQSLDFPLVTPIQALNNGLSDIFITRVAGDGSNLLFSTYLGGGEWEYAKAVKVGGAGNVFVTGSTGSIDFPQLNPLPGMGYPGGNSDSFVIMKSPAGNLVWSTFLGGSYYDYGYGIDVDGIGRPVVVGETYSSDFPTVNAFQSYLRDAPDGFVSRLSHAGNMLEYSTYLGGSTYPGNPTDVVVSGIEGLTNRSEIPYLVVGLLLVFIVIVLWRRIGRPMNLPDSD